jgi:hypothetical protein
VRLGASVIAAPSGLRVFDRDEIPDALRAHGLTGINQDIKGFSQIVGARKP